MPPVAMRIAIMPFPSLWNRDAQYVYPLIIRGGHPAHHTLRNPRRRCTVYTVVVYTPRRHPMSVKHVGVRELRSDLAEKLKGSEPIIIERHGQVLGIYVPVEQVDRKKVEAAFNDFQAALEEVLRQTGMTREELADELDLTHK